MCLVNLAVPPDAPIAVGVGARWQECLGAVGAQLHYHPVLARTGELVLYGPGAVVQEPYLYMPENTLAAKAANAVWDQVVGHPQRRRMVEVYISTAAGVRAVHVGYVPGLARREVFIGRVGADDELGPPGDLGLLLADGGRQYRHTLLDVAANGLGDIGGYLFWIHQVK